MTMHVCVKCQAQYQPKLMGVSVLVTAGNPPKPMRTWRADLLVCPMCGAELLANFSHEPTMESREYGFEAALSNIPQERRYTLHSLSYLAQTVKYETTYVRSDDNHNHLRTTDR